MSRTSNDWHEAQEHRALYDNDVNDQNWLTDNEEERFEEKHLIP